MVKKDRSATIGIKIPELSSAGKDLDDLAKHRIARVDTQLDNNSYLETLRKLEELTAPGSKTITVNYVTSSDGGGGSTFPGTGQPTGPGGGGSGFPGTGQPNSNFVTQLAPRRTPVKVYLDSDEISARVVDRAGRFIPAGSGRRRP
jgi:hypothetical protein